MKIFVIAGEPSGDRLGADLIWGLKSELKTVDFMGVAGALMQAQGCSSLFPMSDLSVMGLAEILPKYRHLKRRIRETAQAILDTTPDVVITIDSPDFCLRVAKIVKANRPSQKIVHYVAPSVWAWRPKRAAKVAAVVDHVLALLPFEPPYMQRAGVSCDFVGHPIAHDPIAGPDDIAAFKTEHGIQGESLAILPGSRKGEVDRLSPIFAETLRDPAFRDHTLIFPTLPHLQDRIGALADSLPQKTVIVGVGSDADTAVAERRVATATAEFALAASGTISLDLAAAGTPMVIAYDMNWFSRIMIKRLLLIDTVTLVNLVSDTRVVPEFLGADCRADRIIPALQNLMHNPQDQIAAMQLTMQRLGRGGDAPGLRAARSVIDVINAI